MIALKELRMFSETTQAEMFMTLIALKLPQEVLEQRLKEMLSQAKQSGYDSGYDQAMIDRYMDSR